jgi:S-adenosylmethionine:tRNA ribosyltransferase-isomerase
MHEEKISVPLSTIEQIAENPEKAVIAVGTTSVRTLESIYWAGVKNIVGKSVSIPAVSQWDPYNPEFDIGISAEEALKKVVDVLKAKNLEHYSGTTQLMIVPGYECKVVNGIITNFHLPKSTLLMLIAAFTSGSWRNIYEYALNNNFRFLSYGDACLLLKSK